MRGATGAGDAIPAIGFIHPCLAIQGKMLRRLASRYGVEWNKKRLCQKFISIVRFWLLAPQSHIKTQCESISEVYSYLWTNRRVALLLRQ